MSKLFHFYIVAYLFVFYIASTNKVFSQCDTQTVVIKRVCTDTSNIYIMNSICFYDVLSAMISSIDSSVYVDSSRIFTLSSVELNELEKKVNNELKNNARLSKHRNQYAQQIFTFVSKSNSNYSFITLTLVDASNKEYYCELMGKYIVNDSSKLFHNLILLYNHDLMLFEKVIVH